MSSTKSSESTVYSLKHAKPLGSNTINIINIVRYAYFIVYSLEISLMWQTLVGESVLYDKHFSENQSHVTNSLDLGDKYSLENQTYSSEIVQISEDLF